MHRDVGVCSIGYNELMAVFLLRQRRGCAAQPAPGSWNGRPARETRRPRSAPAPPAGPAVSLLARCRLAGHSHRVAFSRQSADATSGRVRIKAITPDRGLRTLRKSAPGGRRAGTPSAGQLHGNERRRLARVATLHAKAATIREVLGPDAFQSVFVVIPSHLAAAAKRLTLHPPFSHHARILPLSCHPCRGILLCTGS
jgi:hypothetical protein